MRTWAVASIDWCCNYIRTKDLRRACVQRVVALPGVWWGKDADWSSIEVWLYHLGFGHSCDSWDNVTASHLSLILKPSGLQPLLKYQHLPSSSAKIWLPSSQPRFQGAWNPTISGSSQHLEVSLNGCASYAQPPIWKQAMISIQLRFMYCVGFIVVSSIWGLWPWRLAFGNWNPCWSALCVRFWPATMQAHHKSQHKIGFVCTVCCWF